MKRLLGLDLARSLALFGMVMVNIPVAFASQDTGLAGLLCGAVAGRAAAVFVVLAGVGLSLMTRKGRTDPVRARLDRTLILRRAAFLGLWGLAWYPLWPADILHYYGVWMASAAWLFTLRSRHLLWLSGAVTLAFPLLLFGGLDYEWGWDWPTLTYTGFWTLRGFISNLLFNGLHPVFPWFAFFSFGMWLGRQELTEPALRRRLLWRAVPLWLAAEAFSALVPELLVGGEVDLEVAKAIAGRGPMPPMPQYVLGAGALAVVVILGCVPLADRRVTAGCLLTRSLVHTGQLALTHYVSHVVLLLLPLTLLCAPEEFGLDGPPILPASGPVLLLAMAIWMAVSVWASHRWRLGHQRRGPLEQLMRSLTTPRSTSSGTSAP